MATTTRKAVTEPKAETKTAAAPKRDNMRFWNELKHTDPKATKPFQRKGGFSGTSIDPVYRIEQMTKVFGPVGDGWGYEQLEWTIAERMVFICARVWYVDPDTGEKKFTGPQWGGTEMVRRNRDGTDRPDDECFKMSMTDAIGKCTLQIGLSVDIYKGQFDDDKYREAMTVLHELKAVWPKERIEAFERDTLADLDAIKTTDLLDAYWKKAEFRTARYAVGIVNKEVKERVVEAFSDRKRELVEAEDAARRAEKTGKGTPKAETPAEPPAETEAEPEDTGEAPGYEGSIQQQADRDQAEFLASEEQAEQPAEQQEDQPQEETAKEERGDRPEQAPVYEFDVTAYVNKPPKTLPVQKPDEDAPDWQRFTKVALKIVQHIPSQAWGQRWMDINGGTIDRLEKEGVIMTADGVEYVGKQAAKWIDNAYNKRMAALQSGGDDRRERA